VDDARVVPGLVYRRRRFLLEDDDAKRGPLEQQRTRRREAEDAGADDGDVDVLSVAHDLGVGPYGATR